MKKRTLIGSSWDSFFATNSLLVPISLSLCVLIRAGNKKPVDCWSRLNRSSSSELWALSAHTHSSFMIPAAGELVAAAKVNSLSHSHSDSLSLSICAKSKVEQVWGANSMANEEKRREKRERKTTRCCSFSIKNLQRAKINESLRVCSLALLVRASQSCAKRAVNSLDQPLFSFSFSSALCIHQHTHSNTYTHTLAVHKAAAAEGRSLHRTSWAAVSRPLEGEEKV